MSYQHVPILPPNATPWERLHHEVNDHLTRTSPSYDQVEFLRESPPPQIMPFLIWELGLGELTPYLPQLYALVDEGVRWQRIRGTPGAIRKGLGWIGYDFLALEEEVDRLLVGIPSDQVRLRWSRIQIELDRIRDADRPDLERIAGIGQLSLPQRSYFSRAFHGYDIRAGETGFQKTGACLTSDHSGVFIDEIPTQWSFGRGHAGAHAMTYAELDALDAWVVYPAEGSDAPWASMDILWATADTPWSLAGMTERRGIIFGTLSALPVHIALLDASDQVIGYARALLRRVSQSATGPYTIGATTYAIDSETPGAALVQCRTKFGVEEGQTATAMAIVFNGQRATGVPPGRLWLEPGDLSGGTMTAAVPVTIPLGATIREHCQIIVTLDEADPGPA